MPEEELVDLYTQVRADIAEFRSDMDIVDARLDDFAEKQGRVMDQTRETEKGFEDLSVEGLFFEKVLSTLFHQVKQNSGGLQALTSLAWGYIGAGLDTFLLDVLIPAWEWLTDAEKEQSEAVVIADDQLEDLAKSLNAAVDEEGNLIVSSRDATAEGAAMAKKFDDATFSIDEFGNIIATVGGRMYVFDSEAGNFIGSLALLEEAFEGSAASTELLRQMMGDLETDATVGVDAIVQYFNEGADSIRVGWENVPLMAEMRVRTVGTAAEEVRHKLAAMFVQMGIDPTTGGSISRGAYEAASMGKYGYVKLGVGTGDVVGVTVEDLIEYFMGGAT